MKNRGVVIRDVIRSPVRPCVSDMVSPYGGRALYVPTEPDDIDGLEFWYDGDDASTFSLTGTSVDQWDDKSGNARHVLNGNADATRPTYSSATGRVTFVTLNGTFLQSANFGGDLAQPTTIFVVYNTSTPAGAGGIFDGLSILRTSIYFAGDDWRMNAGATILEANATDANDNIHVTEFNGVTSKYWINGGLRTSGAAGAQTLDGITLGVLGDLSTSFLDGEIIEVFGYNKVLTTSQRKALEKYVTDKWGL